MPEENTLNSLPPGAEAPPAVTTAPAVEPPAASGVELPAGAENVAPDPSKLKDEIEELRKQRQKAEEDAIYWRKQKAEARGEFFKERKAEPAAPPPPAGIGPEPQPGDFDDYNKYVAALTDYKVKAAKTEWDQDQRRREQERTFIDRERGLYDKLNEGYGKYPDFEDVAFDRTATHITPLVKDILADCEHPADVVYYLNKNRVEGVAIARMTPGQAARAIAKIEAKLSSQPAPPPPPPRKTSNAPPPINPIGGASSGAGNKDPDKMSNKEYAKWRESQGARRF